MNFIIFSISEILAFLIFTLNHSKIILVYLGLKNVLSIGIVGDGALSHAANTNIINVQIIDLVKLIMCYNFDK